MKNATASESVVDGVHRGAIISMDGKYRYLLTRHWGPRESGHVLVVCGANPSTADALVDDPTAKRVQGFARRDGYDGFLLINGAAYRAREPEAVPRCWRGIGPENEEALRGIAEMVPTIVCAWGTAGHALGVGLALRIFRETFCRLLCWGVTKDGHPRHPLYLPANTPLVEYRPPLLNLAARIDAGDGQKDTFQGYGSPGQQNEPGESSSGA
jgi:hypothetical protein